MSENQLTPIRNSQADYVTSAAKSILGAVPFAGSLLAEIAGSIIPNQRIDRLAKFASELEDKLASLDQAFVRSRLTDENFTDLMEEGIRQVARSVSDERRDYIASLLSNGLRAENISSIESKHLLRVLGELNDIEVLWLRFFLVPTIGGDQDYRTKHKEVFEIRPAYIGCDQATLDKHALKESYMQHMVELGLLESRYQTDIRTKQPVFDAFTGGLKVRGHQITLLGKLLLRQISFIGEPDGTSAKAPPSNPSQGAAVPHP
ncbi:MAG TPA: hypothetical protein PKJ41_21395 [Bryobacteraceae bacterium]|nr:hypothetical protein [Bryobacteraceae bacterium]